MNLGLKLYNFRFRLKGQISIEELAKQRNLSNFTRLTIRLHNFHKAKMYNISSLASFLASTYTCLAIAVERYIGICRVATHSNSSACMKKFRYYIISILAISAIVDLPKFFEIQTTEPITDINGGVIGEAKY